jgi:hypothetical protein
MRNSPRYIPRDTSAWKDAVSPLSKMSDEEFEHLDAQMSKSIAEAPYPSLSSNRRRTKPSVTVVAECHSVIPCSCGSHWYKRGVCVECFRSKEKR